MDHAHQQTLISAAKEAYRYAYAPYSMFAVGAAILTDEGKIVTGCNVENASYGLSMCAERTAIFKAVSRGIQTFRAIAAVADTAEPISPCGACRQVMAEFCPPDLPVYLSNLTGKTLIMTVRELLPYAFGQGDRDE